MKFVLNEKFREIWDCLSTITVITGQLMENLIDFPEFKASPMKLFRLRYRKFSGVEEKNGNNHRVETPIKEKSVKPS